MNKVLIYIISAFSLFIITSCEDIDYNYKEYLEDVQKYSPAVRNVEVTTELGIITLKW